MAYYHKQGLAEVHYVVLKGREGRMTGKQQKLERAKTKAFNIEYKEPGDFGEVPEF